MSNDKGHEIQDKGHEIQALSEPESETDEIMDLINSIMMFNQQQTDLMGKLQSRMNIIMGKQSAMENVMDKKLISKYDLLEAKYRNLELKYCVHKGETALKIKEMQLQILFLENAVKKIKTDIIKLRRNGKKYDTS